MQLMTLTLGGKTYQATFLDLLKLSIGEARTVKRETGMTITDWQGGLGRDFAKQDPDVLATLLWLFRSRAGESVIWSDLDDVPVMDILTGIGVIDDPSDDPPPTEPTQALVDAAVSASTDGATDLTTASDTDT